MSTRSSLSSLLLSAGLISASLPVVLADEQTAQDKTRELARDIYYFAYPLVLMDVTRELSTNVPDAKTAPMHAPVNQLVHYRAYPPADAKDVVRPNFDTLYSAAWIDLSKEPVILSVPDTQGRYYLLPTLDMWTDVFSSVGSRTTGTQGGHYAYVAPGWKGRLPAGVQEIRAPTSMIWLIGRIQTNGPKDYERVHKIQDALVLTPLSRWGKRAAPTASAPVKDSVDTNTPPLEQVGRLSGEDFFTRFAELMKKYPPHPNDYPILFRMKELGLQPGKSWDPNRIDAATRTAINEGAKDALAEMIKNTKNLGRQVNGWNVMIDGIGTYGTSYLQRATVALAGLGANLPADAVYPTAFRDGSGKPLDAANKYVIHFEKNQLPPADAFWSLTMYDEEGFQVPNPLNRFALGDRDKLKFNPDGSLDLYIQTSSPGKDKESNWLPAPPSGAMGPTLRIYAPRERVLDGKWAPPGIKQEK